MLEATWTRCQPCGYVAGSHGPHYLFPQLSGGELGRGRAPKEATVAQDSLLSGRDLCHPEA